MQHLSPDHPFLKHSANLRAALAGLTQAERLHKDALRRGDDAATDFAARIHQMVVGMVAEAYLRKAVADPDGFNERERTLLSGSKSQLERWINSVDLAFRRHYSVPLHHSVEDHVPAPQGDQYRTLTSMIDTELRVVIEDRNKIAHAQWAWHLNSKETAFTGAAPKPLNYVQIRGRATAIKHLAGLVHVLLVSEPTFQRDYDQRAAAIDRGREEFTGSEYPAFVASLRQRRPVGGGTTTPPD